MLAGGPRRPRSRLRHHRRGQGEPRLTSSTNSPGGTVETVRREVLEELGVPAVFHPRFGERPTFLTVSRTVGSPAEQHVDVSLWFVLSGSRGQTFVPDFGEFHGVRWWTPQEVADADPATVEPHLGRVLGKLLTLGPVS
ncbi:NUDIX hydrolase [Micromonospora avicenniae]|uniref:NUDIX hydrolase n=1 Tax=Micromonospora avicenniae TaxID=1198245 RepID=UPI00341D2FF3